MGFEKILEKATNTELKELWHKIMFMEFMLDCDGFVEYVVIAFENEIKKRLSKGTLKNELSSFPSDWEITVSNCADELMKEKCKAPCGGCLV